MASFIVVFCTLLFPIAVKARSLDQKRAWCSRIKEIILDNYNAVIPDKAKQLVMMLGNKVDGNARSFCRIQTAKWWLKFFFSVNSTQLNRDLRTQVSDTSKSAS